MVNKYVYNNKVRYHFREKKSMILSDLIGNKAKTINGKYKHWRGKVTFKNANVDRALYKGACRRFHRLYKQSRELKRITDLSRTIYTFNIGDYLKKEVDGRYVSNRTVLLDKIVDNVEKNQNIWSIKDQIYKFSESYTGFTKILDILSFSWLFDYSESLTKYKADELSFKLSLRYLYNGFLKNGFKLKSERRFCSLLELLKLKLGKSGLDIIYFFGEKLRPWVGFRKQRLGRRTKQKKHEVRFYFRLISHSPRWSSYMFRRFCLNSPFYRKRTKYPSLEEVCSALLQSLHDKGPIIKALVAYYKLIKKRTPYVQRKKKAKKSRSVEYKAFK